MVDIETTGTDPERSAVIQIAAVRFDYETSRIDTDSMFSRCLSIAANRKWDEDTREWWLGKNRKVYDQLVPRMEPAWNVVADFYKWSTEQGCEMRFWSKPLSFDFPFVAGYFRQFGYDNPYHFRIARDMNSFMAGLRGSPEHPGGFNVEFEGDEHDALFDCIHQIRVLFAAKQSTGRYELMEA